VKTATTRIFALAWLTAGLLGVSFNANAIATWTFSGTGGTDANGEPLARTSGYTSVSDGTLSISGAYATSGPTGTGFAATTTWNTGAPNANTLFFSGGGLGMCSDPTAGSNPGCSQPNHALDNAGNTEAILLNFGSTSVVLNSINIGYKGGLSGQAPDADISLFRYIGAVAPNLSGDLANRTSMLADGWELIGNYGDLVTTSAQTVNTGNKGSSWWLISAYNTSYGSATTGSVNQGNDYYKLAAVTGTKCTSTVAGVCKPGGSGNDSKVPEPGSLALVSLALFGAVVIRRQGKQSKG